MTKAVVVGSGPNGLAAALTLAAAGVQVEVLEAADTLGGGTRSSEATLPGLVHDDCSGFHPLAVDTPFSRAFDLAGAGLEWRWPQVQYAHPLDSVGGAGRGAAAYRSVAQTAAELGSDGDAWRRIFGGLETRFGDISEDFLRPLLRVPSHPVQLARFGAYAALPATVLAQRWRGEEGKALFGGVAAHALTPLTGLASSAIGVALGAAAHTYGWPVAQGGSEAITRAVVALAAERGVRFTTGVRVTSLAEVAHADFILLDLAPAAAADVAGDALRPGVARALRRYRHGPGVHKVEFAVAGGGVPWTYEPARRAGTVHVAGTFAEIAAAERAVNRGVMPDRPFVLVGQQSVADPTRARGDVHPVYSYAHVPAGFTGDATAAIEAQIERFAPGFSERVLARSVRSAAAMATYNANYVGGDVVTGANTVGQLVMRPRPALDPYRLGEGLYLCSAATPPGAGAHGMCGWNAAQSALRALARQ